ncbi:hypothetical protein ABEB36_011469 [Hypothenemus hampei]|uniref:RPA-interacting protein n=1 Tax=Hypothenemus hampei TaxID=57062 RepID=A0ABD1EFJ0_HYPHA
MLKNQASKRVQRARSELSHRRTSMDSLKTQFRTRFLEKLRTTRSKSADRLRQIVENYENDNEGASLEALRSVLLTEQEDIDNTDNFEILKEIEEELRHVSLQYEADVYEQEKNKETEDAVERLMEKCHICQNFAMGNICPKCTAEITSEFI